MSRATPKESRPLSILHVLTLNGRNGEYGGPLRVAREISKEFVNRGHMVEIFSGARRGSEPIQTSPSIETFVLVRPLLKALPLSSLWSFKVIPILWKKINKSEIIHIHFARDLIPITAAIFSLIQKKPYMAQTHGMIISDGRLSTRVIDSIFTKPLLNRSETTLVLTEIELAQLKKANIVSRFEILPNGIEVKVEYQHQRDSKVKKIVFCSRLQKRKGIDKFTAMAEHFKLSTNKYIFEIYGPDGGELQSTLDTIKAKKLKNISYMGSLAPEEVSDVLKKCDLLVLPSKGDTFPMIVLESLSVGTPVLVMPSCGLANDLRKYAPEFVAIEESLDGLISRVQALKIQTRLVEEVEELMRFCETTFGISKIVDRLEAIYRKAEKDG